MHLDEAQITIKCAWQRFCATTCLRSWHQHAWMLCKDPAMNIHNYFEPSRTFPWDIAGMREDLRIAEEQFVEKEWKFI